MTRKRLFSKFKKLILLSVSFDHRECEANRHGGLAVFEHFSRHEEETANRLLHRHFNRDLITRFDHLLEARVSDA